MDNEKSLEELITNSLNNIENFNSEMSEEESSSDSPEEIKPISKKNKTAAIINKKSSKKKKVSHKISRFKLSPIMIQSIKISLIILGIYLLLTSKSVIDFNIKLFKYETDNYKCVILRSIIFYLLVLAIIRSISKFNINQQL